MPLHGPQARDGRASARDSVAPLAAVKAMQAPSYKTLLVSVDAGVATVTLNRPERRNALSARMTNELLYALEDAAAASDVRCTVLTGAGSAFCAGADLGELGGDADAL